MFDSCNAKVVLKRTANTKIPRFSVFSVCFQFALFNAAIVFLQERGLKRILQTKTFSGDNMVYCNEKKCRRKREATSVSLQTPTMT